MEQAQLQNLVLYSSFAAVSAAVLFVLQAFWRGRDQLIEKLQVLNTLNEDSAHVDESAAFAVGPGSLERALPVLFKFKYFRDRIENQKVRLKLAQAGFSVPGAPAVYVIVKLLVPLVGSFAGLCISICRWGLGVHSLSAVAAGAAVGYLLPDLYLSWLARRRKRRILRSLPEALDLMVIAAEIGNGIDAVINRVIRDLSPRAPDLAAELALYSAHLRLGRPRKEALRDLGMRAGVDDLNAFAAILIQSDRFGSSLVVALRQLSDSMRIKRRQMAEEVAQKTAVKLLFPLVLFIFPGIFVILVGPAALSLINDLPRAP